MERKEKVKILAALLDENYYFKPGKDGQVSCKYEIDEDGEALRVFNPNNNMLIYGNESIARIVEGVGLSSYVHYSVYNGRLEYVIN